MILKLLELIGDNSLVVASSRQSLVELDKCSNYQAVDLLRLSTADGIMLLKSLKVEGLPHEFVRAVETYGGHAVEEDVGTFSVI